MPSSKWELIWFY